MAWPWVVDEIRMEMRYNDGKRSSFNMMRGLGVYCEDNALLLLCEFSKGKQRKIVLAMSEDGVSFSLSAGKLSFLGKNGKPESIHSCSDFRNTKIKNSYFCGYAKTTRKNKNFLSS